MTEPRILDDEIIHSWYIASDEREPEWWEDIDRLLTDFAEQDFGMRFKMWVLRRDLQWLRHEAWKRGYPWGKERRRWSMTRSLRKCGTFTRPTRDQAGKLRTIT